MDPWWELGRRRDAKAPGGSLYLFSKLAIARQVLRNGKETRYGNNGLAGESGRPGPCRYQQ